MVYTEVNFIIEPFSEAVCDALIAELGTIGYDGFSYTDKGFSAYIPAQNFNRQAISNLQLIVFFSENYRISFTEQEIADQDWNKTWEL